METKMKNGHLSKSAADSWKDAKVAAARSARYSVRVRSNDYRSVAKAFKKLGLDAKRVIAFRRELLASPKGRAKFGGYIFTIVKGELTQINLSRQGLLSG